MKYYLKVRAGDREMQITMSAASLEDAYVLAKAQGYEVLGTGVPESPESRSTNLLVAWWQAPLTTGRVFLAVLIALIVWTVCMRLWFEVEAKMAADAVRNAFPTRTR